MLDGEVSVVLQIGQGHVQTLVLGEVVAHTGGRCRSLGGDGPKPASIAAWPLVLSSIRWLFCNVSYLLSFEVEIGSVV